MADGLDSELRVVKVRLQGRARARQHAHAHMRMRKRAGRMAQPRSKLQRCSGAGQVRGPPAKVSTAG